MRYTLEVDFLESANGARKRVTMPDGGALDLQVPEGVNDGQVLRLKGKGSAGPRGRSASSIALSNCFWLSAERPSRRAV